MKIPSIDEIDIKDKRVLIRADLDVPLTDKGEVGDDSKITRILPTLQYAIGQKAKVILASHLGKPGGRFNKQYSLEPVGRCLSRILDSRIYFPENSVGNAVKKVVSDMHPGEVVLLENLDFHKQEGSNGGEYAKRLSETADVYVNEAFSVSGQKRSSLVAVTEYIDTVSVGIDFKRELEGLDRIRAPERPLVVIAGGSRVAHKMGLMEALLRKADTFLVGGAVGNTFLKALGKETGASLIDDSCIYRAKKLISGAAIREIGLVTPVDAVSVKEKLRNGGDSYIIPAGRVPGGSKVLDIGPKTRKEFAGKINGAETVLLCGPLGVCEVPEFSKGTGETAMALAQASAFTAAMGTRTVSTLDALGIKEKKEGDAEGMDFISRGGDASIEYIVTGTLPAVYAIRECIK